MQKAEYLLQGSDDSDLISCNRFRHTDNTAMVCIPMTISNCLVVVRDFLSPKSLSSGTEPDVEKSFKKKEH